MQKVQALHDESASGSRIDSVKTEVLKTVAYTLLRQVYGVTESQKIDIQQGINFYDEVRRFEVNLIKQALFHTKGKQSAAASLLNLNATTLHSKIKFYGIEMPSVFEGPDVTSEVLSHQEGK
jgi:Response regulator containing CheY-like receiver, AAA-type ATPase, and DNA-binding domains